MKSVTLNSVTFSSRKFCPNCRETLVNKDPKHQNKSDASHRISPAYRYRVNQCLPRILYNTKRVTIP